MAVYQGSVGEAPNTVWPPQSGNGDWGDGTNYPINTIGVSTSSPLGDPDSSNPPGGPDTGYSSPDTQMTGGGSGESLGRTAANASQYTRADGTVVDVPESATTGANINTTPNNTRAGTLGAPSSKYSGQNAPGFWETLWDWTTSTTIGEKLNPSAPTPIDATFGVSATGAPLDSTGKPRPAANYLTPPNPNPMPAWEKGLIFAGLLAAGAVVVFGLRETKGLVTAVRA